MRGVIFLLVCLYLLRPAASAQATQKPFERGLASWYGAHYHGRQSASGEIYDQDQLTAAHPTLPFGTKVRVRRLDQDSSVVVRINDRGPFVKSRVIDLSRAAAAKLGIRNGVVPVILEVVETPPVTPHHSRMFNRAVVKHVPHLDTSGAAQ